MKTYKAVTTSDLQHIPARKREIYGTLERCVQAGEQRAKKYQGTSYVYEITPEGNIMRFSINRFGTLRGGFGEITNFSFNGVNVVTQHEFNELLRLFCHAKA